MLLPACKLSTFKLLVVGRFAKGEGFFWLDDLDGILLARRESLAVLLKNRRMPAMKKSTVLQRTWENDLEEKNWVTDQNKKVYLM